LAELTGVSAIAVAQPVLASFADDPAHFLLRGASRFDIVSFALLVVLGPPLLAWGLELVAGLAGRGAAERAHRVLMGCFAGSFVAVLLRAETSWRSNAVFLAAGVVGIGVALAAGLNATKVWARVLCLFAIWLVAWFLVLSPVTDLVRSGSSAGAASRSNDNSIVFVVLDELPVTTILDRDGEIDAELFPGFARLAEVSTWYRRARTTSDRTWLAVPAMLTGRMPQGLRVPSVTAYPDNLFTLLEQTHDFHVSELFAMCPKRSCSHTAGSSGSALDDLVADAWRLWTDRLRPSTGIGFVAGVLEPEIGPREVDRFHSFVRGVAASRRPTVHFLHVLLPHARWQFLPSGERYADPDPYFGLTDFDETLEGAWTHPAIAELARQRHVLQTMYVDRLVAQLFEALADRLDDTAIVVTADHGISFRAGVAQRMVEAGNELDVAHVPLFVHAPGQRTGEIDDRPVTHVDLLPTLAAQLAVDVAWDLDGDDLAVHDPSLDRLMLASQRGDGGLELVAGRLASVRELARARALRADTLPPALRPYASGIADGMLGAPAPRGLPASVHSFDHLGWLTGDGEGVRAAYVTSHTSAPPGTAIVLAVDGTVAGIRRSWEAARGSDVAFVVPPPLQRDAGRLALYELDESGTLHRLTAAP
jgi:hypothetical protein